MVCSLAESDVGGSCTTRKSAPVTKSASSRHPRRLVEVLGLINVEDGHHHDLDFHVHDREAEESEIYLA
jgi:hypothetical protein